MPTIKDIASVAGVSRGTVDRVVNNRGRVRPETERRIREALELLNYTPSKAGRGLAMKKKNTKFGFIFFVNNGTHLYFKDVEDGIRSKAFEYEEFGITVDVQYTKSDDIAQEISLLESYKAQGYSGVAIMPVDDPAIANKIDEMTACGIPVITIGSDVSNSSRIAHVGNNYFQSGKIAAGIMNLICNGSANIGIVSGSSNILCHNERINGFKTRLEEAYPRLRIIDTINNHDDDIEGYIRIKEMLCSHPEIDALFLATAGIYGICRYIIETKKALPIVCYDCLPQTRQLIIDGVITATIDQDPYSQGKIAMELLFNNAVSGMPPEHAYYYTEPRVAIRENFL